LKHIIPRPQPVFILAGGLGTRIRAMFPDSPKSLVPIRGKPFLQWQLELLIRQGFSRFVLCVGYLSEKIIRHFDDGTAFGVEIEYSIEESPLGTAGAIKNAARLFQQTSLVLNGDTYLATDYHALIAHHSKQTDIIGSLGLVTVQDTSRYGQVVVNSDQRITQFREKARSPSQTGLVNAGVYILEPSILDYIPAGRPVSMEQETFPVLADAGLLHGFQVSSSFVDMGTPEGLGNLEALLRP
jgi:mannose-1-phosphate guanylyltransferase